MIDASAQSDVFTRIKGLQTNRSQINTEVMG